MQEVKRKLSLRILTQFFFALTIMTGILVMLFVAALFIGIRVTWHPGPVYDILRFMVDHTIMVFGICWVGGFIIIFIRYWIKTLGYLEHIIKATEAVYRSESEFVPLPEELKEVGNQLNQIKRNVRESERTAKEAEQRKNDLIVYLAHDLKTPLTSVIGYLTLLLDEGEISAEVRKKYLSISLEKAQRLEELINEFFEITRYNLTSLPLEISRVNLTRMLEQVTYEFQPALAEKGLHIELEAAPELCCMCDANKMQRVFDNILRNAVNYAYAATAIRVISVQEGSTIKIRFCNRGDTIAEEKLEKIFEPFCRLDSARASGSGGAGLGLSIAREILSRHGGTITARSEGGAIEFEISIPAGLQGNCKNIA